MEDFLTIVHPISKNRISIFSSPGRNLLKSYLQTYKNGGSQCGTTYWECDVVDFLYSKKKGIYSESSFERNQLRDPSFPYRGTKVIDYIKNKHKKFREGYMDRETHMPKNLININNKLVIDSFLKKNFSQVKKDLSLLAYPMFYFKKIGELPEGGFKNELNTMAENNSERLVWDILEMNDDVYLGGNVSWDEGKINGMDLSELKDKREQIQKKYWTARREREGLQKTVEWFTNPENLKKYKKNIYNI